MKVVEFQHTAIYKDKHIHKQTYRLTERQTDIHDIHIMVFEKKDILKTTPNIMYLRGSILKLSISFILQGSSSSLVLFKCEGGRSKQWDPLSMCVTGISMIVHTVSNTF